MTSTVYQLWMVKNTTAGNRFMDEAPAEQVSGYMAQIEASLASIGAKHLLSCDCAWANEEYYAWGIDVFPDLAARIKHTQNLQKMGWFRYVEAFTLLGTAQEEPQAVTLSNPIYDLWLVKNDPAAAQAWDRLSKEESQALWNKDLEALKNAQAFNLLSCQSYWSNEAFPYFGVAVFPNIEAQQAYKVELIKLEWGKYISAVSLLGVASQ